MLCLENDIEIRIIFDRRFDWESYYYIVMSPRRKLRILLLFVVHFLGLVGVKILLLFDKVYFNQNIKSLLWNLVLFYHKIRFEIQSNFNFSMRWLGVSMDDTITFNRQPFQMICTINYCNFYITYKSTIFHVIWQFVSK